MKKIILILCYITFIIIISSCSSGNYVVSANGDTAEVKLKDGNEFVSEIVCIQDTAIIFATIPVNPLDFPRLFFEPLEKIKLITIRGYDGGAWGAPILLFQVLPALLIAVTASSVQGGGEALPIFLVCAIPAALTALLFATSEVDPPEWNAIMPIGEIENLKIYSRYPEGLSQAELSKLLKRYNQTVIKKHF